MSFLSLITFHYRVRVPVPALRQFVVMTGAMHIKYLAPSQLLLASVIVSRYNRSRDPRAGQWLRTPPALPEGASSVVKCLPSMIRALGLIPCIATINEKTKATLQVLGSYKSVRLLDKAQSTFPLKNCHGGQSWNLEIRPETYTEKSRPPSYMVRPPPVCGL